MIISHEKLEAEIKVLHKRLKNQEEESKKSPEAEAKHQNSKYIFVATLRFYLRLCVCLFA